MIHISIYLDNFNSDVDGVCIAALQLAYHVSPDLKQGNYKGVSWTILNHLQTYLQKKELVLEEFNEKYEKIIVELSTEGHYCTAANTAVALSIYDKRHVIKIVSNTLFTIHHLNFNLLA